MHKKLFTIALSAILVVAMAVPAFAAIPLTPYSMGASLFWGQPDTSLTVMNIYGNGTIGNDKAVTLYEWSNAPDQRFIVQFSGANERPKVYSSLGYNSSARRGYTLNIRTDTNLCTTYYDNASNNNDSEIDIRTQGYANYKIFMTNHNKYLSYNSLNSIGQMS